MKTSHLIAALLLALACNAAVAEALSSGFTYQGELKTAGARANGNFDMELRLFNAETGGSQLGPAQSFGGVTVTNGLFTVFTDFGPAQFAGERQWLEIRIRSAAGGSFETLSPRTEVTATPYAWAAANALAGSVTGTSVINGSLTGLDISDGSVAAIDLADNSVSGQKIADGSIFGNDIATESIGSTRIADGNVQGVDLADNAVSGQKIADGSIFGNDIATESIGSTRIADGNVLLQDLAANSVNGAKIVDGSVGVLDVDPTQLQARVIGTCAAGSSIRVIAANGTVTCQVDDVGTPGWSLTGNAGTDSANDFLGTTDNQPFNLRANNQRVGQFAARGTISSWGDAPSVALGSAANVANAPGATVAGGGATRNSVGVLSALQNRALGDFATVGGGYSNTASAFSTIAGGNLNVASGPQSTVGGGSSNIASGDSSTVSGGVTQRAYGVASTVSGGFQNCAGGDYSWAGGARAKVRPGNEPGDGDCISNSGDADGDNGTVVWADDQPIAFVSTGPRQFLVRAQGGMAINTNAPAAGAALTVNGDVAVSTTGSLNFGSQVRQMLNLWGPDQYGIGVQASRLYYRTATGGGFSWFEGGAHSDTADNAGVGGTLRMRLSNTGQLQTSTGTISTLSDARLKKDVHNYLNAMAQINALRPVHYTYIDGGKANFQPAGEQLGFIAQEIQQVFPQWVDHDDDGNLMLSMRGFEALAVRGMQELSAENALLREQLADLAQRLETLERLAAKN